MHIHRDARIVYLAHPRTASVSTEHALKLVGFEPAPQFYRHMRLVCSPWWRRLSSAERERWLVLTTVRNHHDALASWFAIRPLGHERLSPEYVEDLLTFEGGRFLTPQRDKLWTRHSYDADVRLRFETLEADLNLWLRIRGLGPVELPRLNQTKDRLGDGRDVRGWYDRRTWEYVSDRFSDEMAEFGYGD